MKVIIFLIAIFATNQYSWQFPSAERKPTINPANVPDDIWDSTKMHICQPTNFINMFRSLCHYTAILSKPVFLIRRIYYRTVMLELSYLPI